MNVLLGDERNWPMISEELASAGVKTPTVYNVGIDFMLLEGFEILGIENIFSYLQVLLLACFQRCSAFSHANNLTKPLVIRIIPRTSIEQSCIMRIESSTRNSEGKWLAEQSFEAFSHHTSFQHQDGFLTTFLTLIEDMTPVFAWGILGPDSPVKPMCTFIKVNQTRSFATVQCICCLFQDTVLDFARSLYDLKRTDYTSLANLTTDIDRQMNNLLSTLVKEMNVDPKVLSFQKSIVRFN